MRADVRRQPRQHQPAGGEGALRRHRHVEGERGRAVGRRPRRLLPQPPGRLHHVRRRVREASRCNRSPSAAGREAALVARAPPADLARLLAERIEGSWRSGKRDAKARVRRRRREDVGPIAIGAPVDPSIAGRVLGDTLSRHGSDREPERGSRTRSARSSTRSSTASSAARRRTRAGQAEPRGEVATATARPREEQGPRAPRGARPEGVRHHEQHLLHPALVPAASSPSTSR